MFKPGHQLFSFLILLLLSCNNEHRYKYAIKDFRKPLQSQLLKIVSTGVVDTRGLYEIATNKELIQLSHSEHPVLRASAIRVMLYRNSHNQFDILMDHLDDTALVITNRGEFGYGRTSVSDDVLYKARWNSQEEKNKTINEVITKHNYLRSAYTILSKIEPKEKYYSFIKDMAVRGKSATSQIELSEYDIDAAVYALAEFKKGEDVIMIKNLMLSNLKYLSFSEWRLMKELPDANYFAVYESYYSKYYYEMTCGEVGQERAVAFIYSIASYKTERSAKILNSIYNNKPFSYCQKDTDTNYIRHDLISAILHNECDAYLRLRQQIEKGIPGFDKRKFQLPEDNSVDFRKVSPGQEIRW